MPRALKVSEAAALALHSMGLIAAVPEGLVSTRNIADRFQISEAHLSKVLQRLVKSGLLTSVRGPKGGFSLTRPPQDVTLLEVYEAIEGPIECVSCLFNTAVCDGDCILGTVLNDINEILRRKLQSTSLADIRHVLMRERPIAADAG